ncbi:MAG: Deoxyuridine 5-triphosphate nucleotidohydrolase [Bacteroidota bacterium]|jgi:dUTP pyrophosphatase
MEVRVKVINKSGNALPEYQTAFSAGLDVRAANVDAIVIPPGGRALVPTGLYLEIPKGFEVQVRSRSGLAYKSGVYVLNAPGTIDADYRGEVGVILANAGAESFLVESGERIAQLVLAPVTQLVWEEVLRLNTSDRGQGGFGSTGKT